MLVLSRKKNQSIRFPNLGVSVEILRIVGNAVRLGIDAPPSIKILRDELTGDDIENQITDACENKSEVRHQLRNQLNAVRIALALCQKQFELGMSEAAESTLSKAITELEKLNDGLPSVSTAPAKKPVASETNPRRALIVEDDENERELLAGYLRLSGFQVDTASNGLEAIKYLADAGEDRPQAVVLDMKMPIMDGAQTVSNIRHRKEFADLKVFAVSGSSADEMNVSVGQNGVNRWLAKPVNPEALVREIKVELNDIPADYVWPLGVQFCPDKVRAEVTV